MVTYDSLFTYTMMLCAVVTLVIFIARKKQCPRPGKIRRCFCRIFIPAAGLHPVIGSLVKHIIGQFQKICN